MKQPRMTNDDQFCFPQLLVSTLDPNFAPASYNQLPCWLRASLDDELPGPGPCRRAKSGGGGGGGGGVGVGVAVVVVVVDGQDGKDGKPGQAAAAASAAPAATSGARCCCCCSSREHRDTSMTSPARCSTYCFSTVTKTRPKESLGGRPCSLRYCTHRSVL